MQTVVKQPKQFYCMGSGCGRKYDKTSNFIAWEVGVVVNMTKQKQFYCMGSGYGHKYDKTSNFIAWEVGVIVNMTKQAILLHGKWVWLQIRSDKNAPEPQCHPSAFCECIYTHSFLGTLWP